MSKLESVLNNQRQQWQGEQETDQAEAAATRLEELKSKLDEPVGRVFKAAYINCDETAVGSNIKKSSWKVIGYRDDGKEILGRLSYDSGFGLAGVTVESRPESSGSDVHDDDSIQAQAVAKYSAGGSFRNAIAIDPEMSGQLQRIDVDNQESLLPIAAELADRIEQAFA